MITFLREDVDNGQKFSCNQCTWYEPTDLSVGIWGGCTHPILYTDSGDTIEAFEKAINECLNNPRHCCLMDESVKLNDELHRTKKQLKKALAELKETKDELEKIKNINHK